MILVNCCLTCENFSCLAKKRVGVCNLVGEKKHILQSCNSYVMNYERVGKMLDHAEQEGVTIEHR